MGQSDSIHTSVLKGNIPDTQAAVKEALAVGTPAEKILKESLIAAMTEVGRLFEACEIYVPEMLAAARAMQSGLVLLKPYLAESGATSIGRVVLGTVKGDLHDIGKNLVGMMLEGAGFEVIDLGNNVPPEKFVAAVQEREPSILGMSALLTTTMSSMGSILQALERAGVRNRVKVIVGGAPVTENFAKQVGADGYAPDAAAAVRLAKALVATSH